LNRRSAARSCFSGSSFTSFAIHAPRWASRGLVLDDEPVAPRRINSAPITANRPQVNHAGGAASAAPLTGGVSW
jgi:hypothetical protein